MECKMSLVRALDMAALSAKCSSLSMVYNGDILHSLCVSHTKCEPQQVRAVVSAGAILSAAISSARTRDILHSIRAS